MAATANMSYYRGEDVDITVTMSPVEDITGWSITFTVRKTFNVLPILIQKSVGSGITITDGPNGVFVIHVDSADTANLDVGAYHFDIQRTDVGNLVELT